MKKILIVVLMSVSYTTLFAKTETALPPKDSKIFITSTNSAAIPYAAKDLNKWGYWQATDNKNNADFIISYQLRKSWIPSFFTRNLKGYAQIINAKTGEVIFTSSKANSYWTVLGYNHKKTIIKKLNRRIEKNIS